MNGGLRVRFVDVDHCTRQYGTGCDRGAIGDRTRALSLSTFWETPANGPNTEICRRPDIVLLEGMLESLGELWRPASGHFGGLKLFVSFPPYPHKWREG